VAETLGGLRAVPGMRPERLGSMGPETCLGVVQHWSDSNDDDHGSTRIGVQTQHSGA
jgi:hypothetical protein